MQIYYHFSSKLRLSLWFDTYSTVEREYLQWDWAMMQGYRIPLTTYTILLISLLFFPGAAHIAVVNTGIIRQPLAMSGLLFKVSVFTPRIFLTFLNKTFVLVLLSPLFLWEKYFQSLNLFSRLCMNICPFHPEKEAMACWITEYFLKTVEQVWRFFSLVSRTQTATRFLQTWEYELRSHARFLAGLGFIVLHYDLC